MSSPPSENTTPTIHGFWRKWVGQLRIGDFKLREISSRAELQIPLICPSQLQITTSGVKINRLYRNILAGRYIPHEQRSLNVRKSVIKVKTAVNVTGFYMRRFFPRMAEINAEKHQRKSAVYAREISEDLRDTFFVHLNRGIT